MCYRITPLLLAFLAIANAAETRDTLAEIRYKISAGDMASADAIADQFCQSSGPVSDCAAAISWLARGALVMKEPDLAVAYLKRSKLITDNLSKTIRPEKDYYLAWVIGANIEVEAKLLVLEGHRDKAIELLQSELPHWKLWSIQARIQKNLDLLTLEGKLAPILPPGSLGHPVLLFLWGHWCSDCTGQAPVIAKIKERYASRGLIIVAPTRRLGVDEDDQATPEKEDAEIERVWKQSYPGLADVPHAADQATMLAYGVSSTPTLVLIDKAGIVRMYAPYRLSESALASRIDALLR